MIKSHTLTIERAALRGGSFLCHSERSEESREHKV